METSLWAIVLSMFSFSIIPTSDKQLEKYKKTTVHWNESTEKCPQNTNHQIRDAAYGGSGFAYCSVFRGTWLRKQRSLELNTSQVMPRPWRVTHRKYKGKLLQNSFEKILPCQPLKQLSVNIIQGSSQTES